MQVLKYTYSVVTLSLSLCKVLLAVDSIMSLQAVFHSYPPLVILCCLIIIIFVILIFLSVRAMGTVVETSTSYTVETIPGEK